MSIDCSEFSIHHLLPGSFAALFLFDSKLSHHMLKGLAALSRLDYFFLMQKSIAHNFSNLQSLIRIPKYLKQFLFNGYLDHFFEFFFSHVSNDIRHAFLLHKSITPPN